MFERNKSIKYKLLNSHFVLEHRYPRVTNRSDGTSRIVEILISAVFSNLKESIARFYGIRLILLLQYMPQYLRITRKRSVFGDFRTNYKVGVFLTLRRVHF